MRTIDLGGEWTVTRVGHDLTVPALVPGQVQMDLLRAGVIEDPHYRDRETEYVWIGHGTWEYKRTFVVDAEALAEPVVRLVCEGLDTVAAVSINGAEVATTDNMFRRYVFDVESALREGENEIAVRFTPPMDYATEKQKAHPYPVPYSNMGQPDNHNFVRKAGTHFGWDWGPYLYAVGIWRPIRIEAFGGAKVAYVKTRQDHENGGDVALTVTAYVDAAAPGSATVGVSVCGATAEKTTDLAAGDNRVELSLVVSKPALWWPRGYGEAKLHDLVVEVASGDETDRMTKRVGFRSVELVREKDEVGESFLFRVNGVPVYAKGANWIPADSFDELVTREMLGNLLTSARDANMNMIRVWGGGIYESEDFYDLCDELGLMVWQDFMFACALYPADEAFLANVEAEARHQIRRIASHACIVLWCGNNENEQALKWYKEAREEPERYKGDYSKLYVDTLARVVGEEDPTRTYWPSSPSNGVNEWGNAQDQTRGDVHYWAVWHGGKPFSDYLTVCPRFSSEFGFQSFPSLESLAPVLGEEDYNVTSRIMEYRQRSGRGNLNMIQHASRWFRMPDGFANFVYVSQVLQALSLKTGIEHWRRLKPQCMGAIYWQINDIWQGPSWSSLEYDGRWKMLHYYARHFFAPVLVSAYEDGEALQVWVTSDERERVSGRLEVALWSWTGERLSVETQSFEIDALGSAAVWTKGLEELLEGAGEPRECFVTMAADLGGREIQNVHFLSPLKHAELPRATVTLEVAERGAREFAVTVTTDAAAPFVFLSTRSAGRFSDNGMVMLPGEKLGLTFHAWEDVTADELRESLSVKTLRDSYA